MVPVDMLVDFGRPSASVGAEEAAGTPFWAGLLALGTLGVFVGVLVKDAVRSGPKWETVSAKKERQKDFEAWWGEYGPREQREAPARAAKVARERAEFAQKLAAFRAAKRS